MKVWLALILTLGCNAGTSCKGSPGILNEPEIIWTAPTNNWPEDLWVYKVVPQEFSKTVVSNLLAISGFVEKDPSKVPPFFAEKDPQTIFFGNLEGHYRHLAICPSLGFIEYVDPKAQASSQLQKVEDVPNEQEATQLGLKFLRLLGIDISQIARKPASAELDLHWQKDTIVYIDQNTKAEVVLTNGYGVLFARQIDGIKVHGFGGMDIVFGNDAKISSLRLCWRNLTPSELRHCPYPQGIIGSLKKGETTLHPLGSVNVYPQGSLKKLTVTKATFLYEGRYYDEPMDLVRPYLSFEGIADSGHGETGVWFECHF
jgi:hypothetical protein